MSARQFSDPGKLLRVGLRDTRQLSCSFIEPLLPGSKLTLSTSFEFFESKTKILGCFVDAHALDGIQINFLPELENLSEQLIDKQKQECLIRIT